MTSLAWLIGLVAVTCLCLVAVACSIFLLFRESRRALALDRRLLAVRTQAMAAYGAVEQPLEDTPSPALSFVSTVLASVVRVAAMLVPVGVSERAKIGELIIQAGIPQRDALAIFLSLKMILALVAGVSAGILASEWGLAGGHFLAVGFVSLAGAVLGGLVPEALLRRLAVRRRNQLSRALPDALDLMVLCVEAGYTFERALSMVSQELRPLAPELAAELAAVEGELRLGADRRAALQGLHARTACEGLRDFAMTVVQGERYGTPIGQSLRNIARNERAQRAARIEAQAGRLPVIMSLPMLLFVVPGIIMLMAGPAFVMALKALKAMTAGDPG